MIHTYYIEHDTIYENYYIVGIVLKAESKKEALIKIKSRFPLVIIKEYDIVKLDKLEMKVFSV